MFWGFGLDYFRGLRTNVRKEKKNGGTGNEPSIF